MRTGNVRMGIVRMGKGRTGNVRDMDTLFWLYQVENPSYNKRINGRKPIDKDQFNLSKVVLDKHIRGQFMHRCLLC